MDFITETSPFVCLRERNRERERECERFNQNSEKNICCKLKYS